MKKFWALFTLLLAGATFCLSVQAADAINRDGFFKGIRLAGRVKVVNAFPDIKVQVVNAFPDLRVKTVNALPNQIGEWQFVEHGEDFTIQYVNAFPDIKIKFVQSFPGVE